MDQDGEKVEGKLGGSNLAHDVHDHVTAGAALADDAHGHITVS